MASVGTVQAGLDIGTLVDRPYRGILKLALPTVLAMVLQSVVNEVDLIFFAHLPCPESSTGQAALMPSLASK